jgi:phage shock protein A
MKRFINWLKGLFGRTMDRLEDPEMMLDQAKRDMQAALQSNKEKAVQAITQKNMLENMLKDQQQKGAALETKATMALKQDNRELATQFMREKMNVDATIAQVQVSYDQALATVDQIKVGIKRQEEEVRKKTAEALSLKASWKQAQIQTSITKALEGLSFDNEYGSFGAVTERIKEKQSEAAARTEMQSESLGGKIMNMESTARDMEAEAELDKLQERLGLKPATASTEVVATQTVSAGEVGQGEAEKALNDLEKRLNGK